MTNPNPATTLFNAPPVEPPKVEPPKPVEPPKVEAPAPLAATDIKFPEGVEVQPELFTEFLGVMNNRTLTPAQQAQSLIDLQVKLAAKASERGSNEAAKMRETWVNEVKSDPDYNTEEKWGPVSALISSAIDQYGTPEVRDVAALTGAGDNVHMIKFIHKLAVAAKVGEGRPLPGSISTPPRSAAQILYPNQGKT